MKSNFKMQILLKKEESRLSNFYGGKGSAVALGTRQSQSPLHATTDLRSCSLLSKGSKNSRKSRNSGKGRSTRKLGATGLQFQISPGSAESSKGREEAEDKDLKTALSPSKSRLSPGQQEFIGKLVEKLDDDIYNRKKEYIDSRRRFKDPALFESDSGDS